MHDQHAYVDRLTSTMAEIGSAQHTDEDLGFALRASLGIADRYLLAGKVDKALVAGPAILAHDRRETLREVPEQLAKTTVAS